MSRLERNESSCLTEYIQIFKSLTSHCEPPEDAERWLTILGRTDNNLQAEELAKTNLHNARLCARAQALFNKEDAERSEDWPLEMLRVVKEAILVDLQYQQWSDYGPGSYQHKVLYVPANLDQRTPDMGSGPVISPSYIYQDLWIAFIWNNYRACRIHLHEVLLHCMDLYTSYSSAQSPGIDPAVTQEQSREVIKDLLSGICASIPYCLGDIDEAGEPIDKEERRKPLTGWLMMWPLYVARSSCEQGSAVDILIQEKLEYIGDRLGICRAKSFAYKPRREPWNLS